MKKSIILAGIALLISASIISAANAEDSRQSWYIGLSGGYAFMDDQDLSNNNKISPNASGYGIGASLGFLPSSSSIPLLNVLRFEGEVTYHSNTIDKIKTPNGALGGKGDYTSTAYMANAFYDFQTGNKNWSPYIGAGIGVASIQLPTDSGAGNTSKTSDKFAYQGLAGIDYTPDSFPNTQLSFGYRYLSTNDPNFQSVNAQYSVHALEVGTKLRF